MIHKRKREREHHPFRAPSGFLVSWKQSFQRVFPEPVRQWAGTISTAREARVQLPVTGLQEKPSKKITSQVMTARRCRCWKAGLPVENREAQGTTNSNGSHLCPPSQFTGCCHTYHHIWSAPPLWEVGTFWHARLVNEGLLLWDVKWFIRIHRESRCHRQNLTLVFLSLKCQQILQTALTVSPTLAHPQPLRRFSLYVIQKEIKKEGEY